ncbi:hypothetical protein EHQ58_03445 [Leptospira ognonensis]|uniref:Lipoprotein n=1 Tax=Leptospira ognonensis TaxID=2484945 RepID=A0A4R9K7H9_9LEPT|nr:hypothetical protein [Leptospira ognonensis]TGL62268.1 hypothetical protein EHQ58_03445 [Leptospira ognonensis]
MQKYFLIIFLFALSMAVTNCASSTVGVAASNKPILNTTYETIKSVDKLFTWYSVDLILISVSTETPPTEKIYDVMMEGETADAIINIRYYNEKSVFGPIIRHHFGIRGDLIRYTSTTNTIPTGKGRK